MIESPDLTALAADAYVYGFPLVFDLDEVDRFVDEGLGSLPPTPLNRFGHARSLASPADDFVSINNDTVYSIAQVDVSAGPVRLDVPDSEGRYYVLQFVDAWTNNFAYIGRRATGTAAGSYLLVAPDWDGRAPEDVTVVRFPTAVGTIVGRWAVDGEEDLPAAAALQDGLTLTPPAGEPRGIPRPEPVAEGLEFFEKLRVRAAAFPPAARDRAHQQRFAPLGLLDPESPYADPSPELAEALRGGLARGRATLEEALRDGDVPRQNGWQATYHAFDYNLDFFEVGAVDEPRWKMPDSEVRYLLRALAARGGLWGNHGYEAAYAAVYVDSDERPLDGEHRYEIRFAEEPPCGAFWSITMYDTPDYYLVDNPLGRYSVGDRTPGLLRGPDGALTIQISHTEPEDPAERANWLPAPAGAFRPLLRIYEPEDAIFDGRWTLPPIVRAG